VTSNSGGLTLGIIGGEGGSVTLKEPGTNRAIKFIYGALGACVGVGVRLPKLGRVTLPGATGSSELLTSGGLVTMSPFFSGTELRVDDIKGGCSFVEVGGGAAWGGAGYALTFGMNVAALAAGLTNPALLNYAQTTARGYLLFAGVNFGFQAGVGAGSYVGYMHGTR
jgi:hypothetical protein